MAVSRKKQDDKYLKALRDLVTNGGGNRQCFDCGQKGPTYVNMTIGSFVCTRCSGVLRGLTPPHRVKSISMATFTQEEIDFLKAHGNTECAKTWLGLWDPKRAVHQDHRELMIDKYERKRYYLEPASPLKSLTNAASLITNANTTTTTTSSDIVNENLVHNAGVNIQKPENKQQIQLKPPNGVRKHQHINHNNNNKNNTSNNNNNINNNNNNNDVFNNSFMQHKVGASNGDNNLANNKNVGFGAYTDFVADFGSANIFNAAHANGVTLNLSNGYAKIQTNKTTHQTATSHINSNNNNNNNNSSFELLNGQARTLKSNGEQTTKGSNENFADFDHAPIYNSAGDNEHMENGNGYQFVRKSNLRKKPPLYDVQQIALQQKRALVQYQRSEDEETNETANSSIDDILFTNEIELRSDEQQQLKCAKSNKNPFCDTKINYNNNNDEEHLQSSFVNFQLHNSQNSDKPKFTPLALAAHATAMAVLEQNYHFNNDNKRLSFNCAEQNFFNADDEWYGSGLDWSNEPQAVQQMPSKTEDVYSTTWFNIESTHDAGFNKFEEISTFDTTINTAVPAHKGNMTMLNANNNHNDKQQYDKSKLKNTPTEDRYAALKDLDEQLRESKAAAVPIADPFNSNTALTNGTTSSGSINPFKIEHQQQQRQLQQQQQQQQQAQQQQAQQQQHTVNPFQAPANNYFQAQVNNKANVGYYTYNRHYNTAAQATTMPTGTGTGGPGACGFGFSAMQQEMASTAGGVHEKSLAHGDFNNPFLISGAMNLNNPFL